MVLTPNSSALAPDADAKALEGHLDSISLPESLKIMVASVATEDGDSSGLSLSERNPPLVLDVLGFFTAEPSDDLRLFSRYHLACFSFF